MLTLSELADAIEPHARRLSQGALERSYEDPFWLLRFGERGVRHTREDGDFSRDLPVPGAALGRSRVARAVRRVAPDSLDLARHVQPAFGPTTSGTSEKPCVRCSRARMRRLSTSSRRRARSTTRTAPAGALSARADQVAGRVQRDLGASSAQLSREVISAISYLAERARAPETPTSSRPTSTRYGARRSSRSDRGWRGSCHALSRGSSRARLARFGSSALHPRSGAPEARGRVIVVTSRIVVVSDNANEVAHAYATRLRQADERPAASASKFSPSPRAPGSSSSTRAGRRSPTTRRIGARTRSGPRTPGSAP